MPQENTQFTERTRVRIEDPKRYAVIFHNDDFTTMNLVVEILMRVFFKQPQEAESLMMKVHHEGRAVAGIYPLDIAKSKVIKAYDMASQEGAPLRLTIEEA